MLKSNYFPNGPFLALVTNGCLSCGLITLNWARIWESMRIQLYSTIINSLVGLYNPLPLSAVCHLNLDVLESQMAKELCNYLLAFKPLGFEWVVYVKAVPTDLTPFFKKPMITKKRTQKKKTATKLETCPESVFIDELRMEVHKYSHCIES